MMVMYADTDTDTEDMDMERSRPIERLADALQACLNEAAERGAERAAQRVKEALVPRLDRLDRQDDALRLRLDRQDETLRLIWTQVKGSGRLPIDE